MGQFKSFDQKINLLFYIECAKIFHTVRNYGLGEGRASTSPLIPSIASGVGSGTSTLTPVVAMIVSNEPANCARVPSF